MQRDEALTGRLRTHVERLAGDIGERNVFVPDALQRASRYIEGEWNEQGYAVERLEYDVSGIRCANLVAASQGGGRRSEILLFGAHYDSVMGSPGANDNASGIAALLEISRMFQTLATGPERSLCRIRQ
jgi:acetylornithine deacetylase/succinyl-diaminopimelate desuccinylase-like protein